MDYEALLAPDRKLTDEEKLQLLAAALKQMLSNFDNPIARRRMGDEWSEDSRKFARGIYEKVNGSNIYEEQGP